MTLSELIQELQSIQEQLDDDCDPEVMIAEQPAWPFEYGVSGVIMTDMDDEGNSTEPVVFIGEGSQLAYLRPEAAKALGWQR